MSAPRQLEVTQILQSIQRGDVQAQERLWELIYDELRMIAQGMMKHERPGHTLQPTDLVHEAVIRLSDGAVPANARNRQYLFAAAARSMRQILVDHVRKRKALKREGHLRRVALDDIADTIQEQFDDVLAIHESLERLERLEPRQAQVITLRIFGGLKLREIAEQLGVSTSTVHEDLAIARAWLHDQLWDPSE
jgi:RNA polymerase sigma factor (TIGR02999 family)